MPTFLSIKNSNSAPEGQKPTFFPSVHYLRGIAATLVVLEHAAGRPPFVGFNTYFGWLDGWGHYGVVAFFVISGFVLPLSLRKDYGLGSFPRFFARRLIRIEPTFFASIAATCLLTIFLTRAAPNAQPWLPGGKQLAFHALYLVPFSDVQWINGVYWTLAVEFQFYLTIGLLFPLVRIAAAKSPRWGMLVAIAFGLLAFAAPLCPKVELLHYSPYFALGMLCCISVKYRQDWPGMAAAAVALTAIQWASGGRMDAWGVGLLAAGLILFWKPKGGSDPLGPRLGRGFWFLGTISYSLYVIHQAITSATEPVGRFLLSRSDGPVALFFVNCIPVLAVALSVVAAWLLYLIVEGPSHRLAKKLKV